MGRATEEALEALYGGNPDRLADAKERLGYSSSSSSGSSSSGGSGRYSGYSGDSVTREQLGGSSSSGSSSSGGHPNASGSPIGSGNLDIDIDPDTGQVNESIGGQGVTTPQTEETEDDVDVVEVPSTGSNFEDVVRDVEQAVEDATGGAGFGAPDVVDDIGSGSAVVDITPSDLPFNLPDVSDEMLQKILTGLVVAGVGVAVVAGGD